MRSVPDRRRRGLLGSIPYFIRVGVASGGSFCLQKVCDVPYLRFDHDERLWGKVLRAPSQYHKRTFVPFHRQVIALHCSRSIPVPCDGAQHTSFMSYHIYSESYAHAAGLGLGRCMCSMPPHETAASKLEGGSSVTDKAEWETLCALMRDLKDGLAKGKALEDLKGLVDQLALSAEPTDPKLGLAFLRLARSLEAAGEEPCKYLGYARKALKCFETVDESWDHSVCLFTLGSFYVDLGNIDNAVAMFAKCASVIQQIKGSAHDELRNDNLMFLHHVLGQLENFRGNYHKSLAHYENAIRFGKKSLKPGSPKLPVMYIKAATVCRNARGPEAAMNFAQKAHEGFMTCYGPSSLQVGRVRALMSGIHCDLKKYEEALSDYTEAKPILEYLKHTAEVARMNLDIADLLSSQNKNKDALPFLQEVIKITEVTSIYHILALIRAGIASSELNQGNCAGGYCQKAFEALDHHDVSCHNANDLVHLGLLMDSRGELERAEVLFMKIMKWVDRYTSWPYTIQVKGKTMQLESNDKLPMQHFCKKVGILLFRARKYKEAIPYLQRSLKDYKSGNGVRLFYTHLNLGTSYAHINYKTEALMHLNACKEILAEWFWLHLIYLYLDISTRNRTAGNLVVLESMSIFILRMFV